MQITRQVFIFCTDDLNVKMFIEQDQFANLRSVGYIFFSEKWPKLDTIESFFFNRDAILLEVFDWDLEDTKWLWDWVV